MSTPSRVQRGVPTGGQFAPAEHPEADVDLDDVDREEPIVVAAFNSIEPYSIRESYCEASPQHAAALADVPDTVLAAAIDANMRQIMRGADRAYDRHEDDAWSDYHSTCAEIARDAIERDRSIRSDVIETGKHLDPATIGRAERAWFDQDGLVRDNAVKHAWEVVEGTPVEAEWRKTTYLPIPVRFAAIGKATRHLIGQGRYTQQSYDLLTGPWRKTIGPLHADDPDPQR